MLDVLNKFPIPSLEKHRLASKMELEPSMEKAFCPEYNLTNSMLDWFTKRLEEEQANFYLDVYGPTNSAKTYGGMWLAARLMPGFSNKQIWFGPREVLEHIQELEKKTIILNDDKTRDFGLGTNRRAAEYDNVLQVVRKYQMSLINTAPTPRLFERAHYMLEALFIDRKNRKSRFAIQTADGLNVITLGYVELGHPADIPTFGEGEVKVYEGRKDEFIEKNLRKKGADDVDVAAREVMATEGFINLETAFEHKQKIPRKSLFELVASQYSYLNRNNEVQAIVDRIVFICISEGRWKP